MTAAHVLSAALEHDARAVGRLTEQKGWKPWPIVDHELHGDLRIALLRASSLARVEPPAWRVDELVMLDAVQTVGYPHALDVENRTIDMRAFRGYVCAPTTSYKFPAKPRVHEISMPVPRGLSGAPLWSDEPRSTVVGVVFGYSVVEVPLVRSTEHDTGGFYETTEAHHLGVALQSSALYSLRTSHLGTTFGAFLEARKLVAKTS